MHASPSVESKIRVLEANFRASLRDSPPEADALEALRIFLAGAVDVERQIVDELQAITPTESVAMEHDRLIEVHHALQTSLMEVVEDLKGVSTVVEARPIIEPVMAAAEQQLDLACEGLANIAMREHIQIDWTCLGTVDWSEVV